MQRKQNSRIGIDLLGCDTAPEILIKAIPSIFEELAETATLTLFATPSVFAHVHLPPAIICQPVNEFVTMEDDPLVAVRRKKNSSIAVGMRMLKERQIDAFVSAGNTGALMANAMVYLGLISGITRPALMALLPTKQGEIAVLDVGANVTFTTDHLVQFAAMGAAFQKSRGIARPRVGLLNIGSEAKKGTQQLREAYQKLQELNQAQDPHAPVFIGNVEGRDVFKGEIDVLVTDGFTGNVFLKTAEGIASVLLDQLEENATEECSPHLKSVLEIMRQRLHYAEYPGAVFCGVDGIVVKCHGDSGPQAFSNGIKGALRLIENDFLEKVRSLLFL